MSYSCCLYDGVIGLCGWCECPKCGVAHWMGIEWGKEVPEDERASLPICEEMMIDLPDKGPSEYDVLRRLERRVRKMFQYSGWDDCDEDAAKTVHAVEEALDDIDAWRRIKRGSP